MKHFTLTEEHVALLRHGNVDWNGAEFGAPSIDPKRPYNNSDVYSDIAKILGIPRSSDEDEPFTEEQRARMDRIHEETETALQIVLRTGAFEPGEYVAGPYDTDWRKAP